jgi:hypothetical protein
MMSDMKKLDPQPVRLYFFVLIMTFVVVFLGALFAYLSSS